MPRDGNGNYNLPTGWPVASNTVAQSVTMNSAISDIASALTASMTRDGQGIPTADIPFGGYKVRHIADGILGTDASSLQQAIGTCHWLTGVTGTDTITANSTIGITSISPGMTFAFVVAGNNTGTSPTLNINGLGAIAITKNGASVAVGDLTGTVAVTYNGTSFVLYSADYTTLGQLGNHSIVTLNTVKNILDDGSGNATIYGSLKTTRNTLDDGSGNATIAGTGVFSVGGTQLYKDANGNLGLSVTPSGWYNSASARAIQLPAGSIYCDNINDFYFTQNAYLNSGATAWVYLNSAASTQYTQSSGVHSWYIAPSGTAGSAITWTQAMTLDNSGNLLVGGTNVATMTGGWNIQPNAGNTFTVTHHFSGSASGSAYAYFDYNGAPIGSITQSGTTGVAYNTTSDRRLKENITDAPDSGAAIDRIQIRSFDWKADGSHQVYGVIAQELQEAAPEAQAVTMPEDTDEMWQVDYSKLVPMLLKEVQSLRKRIQSLENGK